MPRFPFLGPHHQLSVPVVILLSFIFTAAAKPALAVEDKTPAAKPAAAAAQSRDKAKAEAKDQTTSKTGGEKIEITVTAPRVEIPLKQNPAATTVVETPLLQAMPRMIAIDEALKLVPGVKVDNQADGERVHLSIRGQGILTERGTRGIKALVDGIPLNDPSGFVSDFFDIDWATVHRLEILRGPAAAFYGSGSSGGIINILTRRRRAGPDRRRRLSGRRLLRLRQGDGRSRRDDRSDELPRLRAPTPRARATAIIRISRPTTSTASSSSTVSPAVKLTAVLGYTDFYNGNAEGLEPGLVQRRSELPPQAGQSRRLFPGRIPEDARLVPGDVRRRPRPRQRIPADRPLHQRRHRPDRPGRQPGPGPDGVLPPHQVHRGRPVIGHPSRLRHAGRLDPDQPHGRHGPDPKPLQRRGRLRLADDRLPASPQPGRRRGGQRRPGRPDHDPKRGRRLPAGPGRARPALGRHRSACATTTSPARWTTVSARSPATTPTKKPPAGSA